MADVHLTEEQKKNKEKGIQKPYQISYKFGPYLPHLSKNIVGKPIPFTFDEKDGIRTRKQTYFISGHGKKKSIWVQI